MKSQWLDIDIDYFNEYRHPHISLRKMISDIPRDVPCEVVVEHQEVLPFMRRAVVEKRLSTPFELFHVDQHYDAYGNRPCRLDCGTHVHYIPKGWITPRGYWWDNHGWQTAVKNMYRKGVFANRTSRQKWNPKQIALEISDLQGLRD